MQSAELPVAAECRWRRAAGLICLVAALLLASCCADDQHRRVSADEFIELAERPVGSAVDTRFIGATESRVFLSLWSALPSSAGGGHHVYSATLEDLPPELAERIRAGENPWPRR